ncbi:MAG: sulfotransferase [Actinomycetia bacterium]|nr:sulfotransferase [Actinomycetes bacterium]
MHRRLRRWQKVYTPRTFASRPLHELRWLVRGEAALERWTDERLAFGNHFWLFVLGLNNSGTSILAHVLETHPLIRSLPAEGQALTRALPTGAELGVRRNWTARLDDFHWTGESAPEAARRARYDWAFYLDRRPGIVLEKSPPNSVRSRWLQAFFAPSRFLAIVRHPYAVCEGMRRRGGFALEDAARHWARGNGTMLADARELDRFRLVTYEEFCAEPHRVLAGVEAFLELEQPIDRAALDEPLPSHTIDRTTARLQDYNARSLERLSPEEIASINEIVAPVARTLGYELR